MDALRRAIRDQVRGLVGSRAGLPPVKPEDSLYPPGSACRKVHGDFTSMMIGGVSALLIQMLHPAALAGVWDHSNFRGDILGRLKRTAQFISTTTFGSVESAYEAIERVKAIHDQVHGTLPDGTSYSANDPDVLTFVHVAGASSFLKAYRLYRNPAFDHRAQDLYYREAAEIAFKLGAERVPRSVYEVEEYFEAIRPGLRSDNRTREIRNAILWQRPPSLALAPFQRIVLTAGVDLMPGWAARLHGLSVPKIGRPALRAGTKGVGALVRWALSS
ncbi:oxygenase MpaB family protein [Terrihabitans soli]|nr:oxygenase MpaB family protein [Terrihabitans soli]